MKNAWESLHYSNDTLLTEFNVNATSADGLAVSIESMGVVSYQKLYRGVVSSTDSTRITFPLLMAIIVVDKGRVHSILWDDTCKWCIDSPEKCLYNTYDYAGNLITDTNKSCWVNDDFCIYNSAVSSLCKLKVYITWTGTDNHGFYFQSAASRFSRMASTQISDFVDRQLKSIN